MAFGLLFFFWVARQDSFFYMPFCVLAAIVVVCAARCAHARPRAHMHGGGAVLCAHELLLCAHELLLLLLLLCARELLPCVLTSC